MTGATTVGGEYTLCHLLCAQLSEQRVSKLEVCSTSAVKSAWNVHEAGTSEGSKTTSGHRYLHQDPEHGNCNTGMPAEREVFVA